MKTTLRIWMTVFLFFLFTPIQASPDDEPLAEKLIETFKKPYLSLGVLLQTSLDFQSERIAAGNNGFRIPMARIVVTGELDKKLGYLLNTNFLSSVAVLDASLYWKLNSNVRLNAGLYRTFFSKEFSIGIPALNFTTRSQIASQLIPGRQIGMHLDVHNDIFKVSAGVYNGNGYGGNRNDNNDLMVMARAAVMPEIAGGSLELGVNGATSNDNNVVYASRRFSGKRNILGADIYFEQNALLLTGEYIYASLDSRSNTIDESNPQGFQATAGYKVKPDHQLLVRWDQIDLDETVDANRLFLFGYNYWPTSITKLRINYIINADASSFDNHLIVLNTQFAF
ncbi:MAG: porin [Calditrichia bacterium]